MKKTIDEMVVSLFQGMSVGLVIVVFIDQFAGEHNNVIPAALTAIACALVALAHKP